jgi:hypothetical protein
VCEVIDHPDVKCQIKKKGECLFGPGLAAATCSWPRSGVEDHHVLADGLLQSREEAGLQGGQCLLRD